MTDLSILEAAIARHRPRELNHTLMFDGGHEWHVVIEFDYDPGFSGVADCPGQEPSASIRAIRNRRTGKDIRDELPPDLVDDLEDDLRCGDLG